MKESLSPHLSRDRVCTILLNPGNNAPKNRTYTVNHFLGYAKSKKGDAKIENNKRYIMLCKIIYVK